MEYDFNIEDSLFDNSIRAVSGISKVKESNFMTKSGALVQGRGDYRTEKVRQSESIKERNSNRIVFSDLRSEYSKKKLFDSSEKNLICDPIQLYSKDYSLCMYDGSSCRSMHIIRINKLPKRYVCKGKKEAFFEIHYKYIDGSKSEYIRGAFGYDGHSINKACTDMSSFRQSDFIQKKKNDNDSFVLTTSMFDDLSDQWITEIEYDGQSILMGSNKEGVRELSDLREEPLTITGRRKAIMHWVAGHTRRTEAGPFDVSTYTRGIDSFNIDNFNIKISPPALSLLDHKHPEKFEGSLSFDIFKSFKNDHLISNRGII